MLHCFHVFIQRNEDSFETLRGKKEEVDFKINFLYLFYEVSYESPFQQFSRHFSMGLYTSYDKWAYCMAFMMSGPIVGQLR